MSKVLEFFGIKKSQDNTQKNLVQSARSQTQGNPPLSNNFPDTTNMQNFTRNLDNKKKQEWDDSTPKKDLFASVEPFNVPNRNFDNINTVKDQNTKSQIEASTFKTQPFAPQQSVFNSSHVQNPVPVVIERLDYEGIKQSLNNLVEKTFPNPFPSRTSLPEDFDKSLVSSPFKQNHIDYLLENSKFSAKTKESLNKKYVDYKREMEFYKKFTNMNDIKKQKLVQEIDDFKKRQSAYNNMNPNDPEYQNFHAELRQQEEHIAHERAELEDIKRQLNQYGGDQINTSQANLYEQQNYAPQYDQTNVFNENAFSKKINNVNSGFDNQYFVPDSDENIYHDYGNTQVVDHNQHQNNQDWNQPYHQPQQNYANEHHEQQYEFTQPNNKNNVVQSGYQNYQQSQTQHYQSQQAPAYYWDSTAKANAPVVINQVQSQPYSSAINQSHDYSYHQNSEKDHKNLPLFSEIHQIKAPQTIQTTQGSTMSNQTKKPQGTSKLQANNPLLRKM